MLCVYTLRSLSRPFCRKVCLVGDHTPAHLAPHFLKRNGQSRMLKCEFGLVRSQTSLALSKSLCLASQPIHLKEARHVCKHVLYGPILQRTFMNCGSGTPGFVHIQNVLNHRLFHHTDHPSIQYQRRFYQTSPPSPTRSFNLVHLGALIIGLTLCGYGSRHFYSSDFKLSELLTQPVHASTDFHKNNFIADVVETAGPAVVFLEIKGRHPLTGRPVTLSNGSGFIVRSNGIILTNAHVVANKSSVSVKLQDGRVFEGQVTAVDPISDLAAVKIAASGLPTIPLGNSSDIRPGEWVLAMGSPLSLSNTVTCGIVSSVQRASKELGLRNKNMDYIQTDAVINFGNSGGPLVNLDGKAIGINTMKVTTGISFAIPSDYAVKFLTKAEALMKNGKTENGFLKRRYMGITMLTLTENVMRDLRNNIKMPNFAEVKGGVFVYKVIPGSPAHLGGIQAGDIIIDISGVAIRSAADVYDAVEKSDHLKVSVIRGSDKKVIPINTQETI